MEGSLVIRQESASANRSSPSHDTASEKTLLRAWRYRDSVKEGAPLRPWLYRVAANACLESIFVVWFQASSETFQ
jgi:hypothetical protein